MAETAEETAALSRAKLEQKDRAELAAIVEAMGGKATSRAKKADLVELVLQLAGAAAPQPAAEAMPAPDAEPEAAATSSVDSAVATPADVDGDADHDRGSSSSSDNGFVAEARSNDRPQDRQGGQPGQP